MYKLKIVIYFPKIILRSSFDRVYSVYIESCSYLSKNFV